MGIEIVRVEDNNDGSVSVTIDVGKQTSQDIMSGFLLRAIINAAKDIDPDRPKSIKENIIERLENHMGNAALHGAPAKAYAFGLAEVINDLGGPDYMEHIEQRFGDVE